ncbi:MAG: LptF/LptG family permease [Bacteroidales bacterium]|nr:LptF/LptG family permease [Bacteroidales bacterium]
MKILDWYIIRKFLGTFFFTLGLIILIVIIFDISEKIDDFINNEAPLKEIIFSYYITFIPFFTNMFSPLITFIAVVFFTSKIAYNTEIVAILSSGISFRRLLRPYLISATLIGLLSFYLANFLIPTTNKIKKDFEDTYIWMKKYNTSKNIHLQNKPGELLYVESFNNRINTGYNFTWEKFEGQNLVFKLKSKTINYDSANNQWDIIRYKSRKIINDSTQIFESGDTLVANFNIIPRDYSNKVVNMEVMDYYELNDFIAKEEIKGSENIKFYYVEKHRRVAFPFATLILTVIGAALSSRKLRGGMGIHLAVGITLSFTYIIFMQISTVFATFGALSPLVAVWIPNMVFFLIAIYLVRIAPK